MELTCDVFLDRERGMIGIAGYREGHYRAGVDRSGMNLAGARLAIEELRGSAVSSREVFEPVPNQRYEPGKPKVVAFRVVRAAARTEA